MRILSGTARQLVFWNSGTVAARAFTYTGSGGMGFGGAAQVSRTVARAYAGSGGLDFAGAAITSKAFSFTYQASGGIVFAGEAATSQGRTFPYTGSDGIQFGGQAATVANVATLQRGNTAIKITRGGSAAATVH
jgi:hypothetical protein